MQEDKVEEEKPIVKVPKVYKIYNIPDLDDEEALKKIIEQ